MEREIAALGQLANIVLAAEHERGVPCSSVKCPQCGGPLTRSM